MAEVEFKSAELMAIFPMPHFTGREITEDARFTGEALVSHGLPHGLTELLANAA